MREEWMEKVNSEHCPQSLLISIFLGAAILVSFIIIMICNAIKKGGGYTDSTCCYEQTCHELPGH